MSDVFVYILKVNLLITIFYLVYHFLVQKETFFNSNRWFLLFGLFTSIILPFIYIKKVVVIQAKTNIQTNLSSQVNSLELPNKINPQTFDWNLLILIVYSVIATLLATKIIIELYSFYKLIRHKKITISKPFALVDLNENINPFSFFKYIVFNSSKYSNHELENILNHEKVHSKEKHSIDILIAKIYCMLFWYNPIIWLYKKAIIQNLEYIADKKAVKNIQNKKAYQITLLKVVTDHNYLSITNSFYQSLIKKRIVMLNKNQSKQKNAWKYALLVPALIAFVVLFQIQTIAQEESSHKKEKNQVNPDTKQVAEMVWTKDTPDEEIKNDIKWMKKEGLEITYSSLKRNSKGEITTIKVDYKDKSGNSGSLLHSGDDPIKPIVLRREINSNNKTSISLLELTQLNKDLTMPLEPLAPMTPSNFSELPTPPDAPDFPALPTVEPPSDPNDKKAMKEFELEMKKYEQAIATREIDLKKYESQMKIYEKKMEARDEEMEGYEKEMRKYDSQMEEYDKKIEEFYEKIAEYREAAKELKDKKREN